MQRDGNKKMAGTAKEGDFTQRNMLFTTLVIEKKESFEGPLEDFLKTEGRYILRAETAEEALAMTRQHWPDLVLLNREMVGVHGLGFLPELLLEHPSAAIIVMATDPTASEVAEAMRLGAVDYLERPLDFTKLKQSIDIQKELYNLL